jgi:hypothetical protein
MARPTKQETEDHLTTMLPHMLRLDGLSDPDTAAELNRLGIQTIHGDRWGRDGFQVMRLRAQMRAKFVGVLVYHAIRDNLALHFGAASFSNKDALLDAAASYATHVYRKERIFNLASDAELSRLPVEEYQDYKRERGTLGALLYVLRAASGSVDIVPSNERVHVPKPRAAVIFEDVKTLARVEVARVVDNSESVMTSVFDSGREWILTGAGTRA